MCNIQYECMRLQEKPDIVDISEQNIGTFLAYQDELLAVILINIKMRLFIFNRKSDLN